MLKCDVRIILRDFGDGGAPQLRDLKHVGFVDRGHFAASLACELEGDAGHANDFGLGVTHGVDGFAGLFIPGARRAEVETTEQFADEENVGVFNHFRTQRRAVSKRSVGNGGSKIGEAAEGLTNLQQARLGTLVGGQGIEFVVTNCTEQDGIAFKRCIERRSGKRRTSFGDGDAADQAFDKGEVVAAKLGNRTKDVGGFAGDFGADAVAGEDCNFETHEKFSSSIEG